MNTKKMLGLAAEAAGIDYRAALAQQEEPDSYGYASRLAVAIWEKHYKDTAPQWKPLDYLIGVLTQIDNMTSGLTRLAQQDEPETCTWQQDGDSDSGVYATSCGRYFRLEDGTPEDNKMAHCCYCGKKLVQELITEDGDD